MAGRFEPPHEHVELSLDELRVLDDLEQAFAEEAHSARIDTGDGRAPRERVRAPLVRFHRWRRRFS